MSRIRSIHPGLFTDPEFVQVSMAARLLLIGLWTEADDHGVFEWKPLALKMKIFPGDAIDMDALLGELIGAGRLRQEQSEGKSYGVCRNFCRYQKPKSPSYRYPFSPAWGNFVGLNQTDSDSSTPALPQDTGKVLADGEERRREEGEKGGKKGSEAASPVAPRPVEPTKPDHAAPDDPMRSEAKRVYDRIERLLNAPKPLAFSPIKDWLANGATEDLIAETVAELVDRQRAKDPNWTPGSLSYFANAVAKRVKERGAFQAGSRADDALDPAQAERMKRLLPDDERASSRKQFASRILSAADGKWYRHWGELPGVPGCELPRWLQDEILAERAGKPIEAV